MKFLMIKPTDEEELAITQLINITQDPIKMIKPWQTPEALEIIVVLASGKGYAFVDKWDDCFIELLHGETPLRNHIYDAMIKDKDFLSTPSSDKYAEVLSEYALHKLSRRIIDCKEIEP